MGEIEPSAIENRDKASSQENAADIFDSKPFIIPSDLSERPPKRIITPSSYTKQIRPLRRKISFIEKSFLKLASVFIIAFIIISTVCIQSVKAERSIRDISIEMKANLTATFEAMDAGDYKTAIDQIGLAATNIKKLKFLAQSFGQDIKILNFFPKDKSQIQALEEMLNIAFDSLNILKLAEVHTDTLAKSMKSGGGYIFDIKSARLSMLDLLHDASGRLNSNKDKLLVIKNSLPDGYSVEAGKVIAAIDGFSGSISDFSSLLGDDLYWLSGEDGKEKKILVIFQNNSELRGGSGGSFGSFGIAKLNNGKLISIDFGQNIYKLDNPFIQKECIPLDNELKFVVTDGCQKLKDSGWAVDGKESLQNIKIFYNKVTGENVDGVITIDTTAFIGLLKITGPVDMPEYGQKIDDKNFREILEEEVHKDYFDRAGNKEENEPKKIISDMIPKFLEKITDSLGKQDKILEISQAFAKSIKEKNILFYFGNESLQAKIDTYNAGGKVTSTVSDYLYVNNSNIGGLKSSMSMDQKIALTATIKDDGVIDNELVLTRNHEGKDLWPDGINKNFVRLLIPEKSIMFRFDPITGNYQRYFDQGFKNRSPYWLGTEAGKEEVNFWMNTKPQEQSQVEVKYSPNYKVLIEDSFNYQITLQKQPGARADDFELVINYPLGYKPTNIKNYDFINRKIILKMTLNEDRTIKINFSKISKTGGE